MEENKNHDIKIILLGEERVGKTSLINAFMDKQFNPKEDYTLEKSVFSKEIQINNKILSVEIWDTMGQEKFRSVTKSLIKDSNLVIFVYDITRRETFLELNFWHNIAIEELENEEVIFGVAANKIDLFSDSEVETTEAEIYSEEKIKGLFYETSAKENPLGFKKFVNLLLEKLIEKPKFLEKVKYKSNGNIKLELNNNKINKKKSCC